MDRKRKANQTNRVSSSRPTKTTRTARPTRRIRTIGGTNVLNVRVNGAKRLQDVKVVKVPNRRAGPGGFTIVATPRAKIGDSGVIDGVRYVVRSESQLRNLIRQKKWRDVERTCTSRITKMNGLFEGTVFNGDIGHWDTSRVTTMAAMFAMASRFNQPIGGWNTSNVRSMEMMFYRASAFNQPIGRWDVSRVVTMSAMFLSAKRFNKGIGDWDVSSLKEARDMFFDADSFKAPIHRWGRRLQGDVAMDVGTRRRVHTIEDPILKNFLSKRHRLHDDVNGMNYIGNATYNTKIPINSAVVIAGDKTTQNGVIRHVFHENVIVEMNTHPMTRQRYARSRLVPLTNVLDKKDIELYKRLKNGNTIGSLKEKDKKKGRLHGGMSKPKISS